MKVGKLPVPFLDLSNAPNVLRLFITAGIVVIGAVAVVYSLIFLGGRVVTPRSIQTRLRAGVIAAVLVIALAALDVYLAVTPN
jgi:hypothetical protein